MKDELKQNNLNEEEKNVEERIDPQGDGTERSDPINQSIETIVNLHMRMERKVGRHQRAVEILTANLGRPRFLYFILSGVTIWILVNVALARSGVHPVDPPPFYWLQGIVGLSALLMTTVVLIT